MRALSTKAQRRLWEAKIVAGQQLRVGREWSVWCTADVDGARMQRATYAYVSDRGGARWQQLVALDCRVRLEDLESTLDVHVE